MEYILCINQPPGISWSPSVSILCSTVRPTLATQCFHLSLPKLHYISTHSKGAIIPIRLNNTISEYGNAEFSFDQIALWNRLAACLRGNGQDNILRLLKRLCLNILKYGFVTGNYVKFSSFT